tara:strand:- start:11 stop:229 length:219 start_codon:yes stop_codon:yes gene_type:complete
MTHDFIEDAAKACNKEKVPFILAMRAGGEDGDWRVTYNLRHHKGRTSISEHSKIIELMRFVLSDYEDESDTR